MVQALATLVEAGVNSKTLLNTFCQRYTKKCITKADIVYETVKFGDQFQSTVTLACLEGAQFAGEVAQNSKEAEQNAAAIAMTAYSEEMAALPAVTSNSKSKKRKAPADPSDPMAAMAAMTQVEPFAGAPQNSMNARLLLNQAMMKILRRPMQKGDVCKQTVKTALGSQCTISLPGLPDERSGLAWTGGVAPKEKDAEENAAMYALQALEADPSFARFIAQVKQPAAKKARTGMGGTQAMGVQALAFGELGGYAPGMTGRFGGMGFSKGGKGGKGKGKGKSRGPPGPKPREVVSDVPVSGTVLEWKGKYGWIRLQEPVDHPMASKNRGKIFLHTDDWQLPGEVPAAGLSVSFTLYADSSGLGADNVMPV